jgi:alpha-methylacyl-CoA racemase
MNLPLAGVKVLDLSRLLPGPYCTLLLADLGADVVRLEGEKGGDMVRYLPPLCEDGQSAVFHALNRGKRSVAVNLRSDEGRAQARALARRADVLVESFRPGVLERMGLAPDALHEDNPRLVVCRISGYGQTGPDRLRAGHDLDYCARAGVLGGMATPHTLPVQVADIAGGSWPAALQVLAALYARTSTGKGAVVDVSMTEGAHALLVMRLSGEASDSDLLGGAVPCYGVYPTADGWLAVGALEPKFWQGLCRALELPQLADKGLSLGEEGEGVRAALARVLAARGTAEWESFFRDHDVCVEPVRAPADSLRDPQLSARGVVVNVEVAGELVPLPRTPLSLSQAATSAGPALGAHTREVLAEWDPQEELS